MYCYSVLLQYADTLLLCLILLQYYVVFLHRPTVLLNIDICTASLILFVVLLYCISTLYCYTVSLRCSASLYLYVVLLHCISTLYCFSVFPRCTASLYLNVVLLHCIFTLYCFTLSLRCTATLYLNALLLLCITTLYCFTLPDVTSVVETGSLNLLCCILWYFIDFAFFCCVIYTII